MRKMNETQRKANYFLDFILRQPQKQAYIIALPMI